jgi:hypothetical protein
VRIVTACGFSTSGSGASLGMAAVLAGLRPDAAVEAAPLPVAALAATAAALSRAASSLLRCQSWRSLARRLAELTADDGTARCPLRWLNETMASASKSDDAWASTHTHCTRGHQSERTGKGPTKGSVGVRACCHEVGREAVPPDMAAMASSVNEPTCPRMTAGEREEREGERQRKRERERERESRRTTLREAQRDGSPPAL